MSETTVTKDAELTATYQPPAAGRPAGSEESARHRAKSLFNTIRSHWVLISTGTSAVVALLVFAQYGYFPLLDAGQQYQLKRELVTTHLELGEAFLSVGQVSEARREFERAQALDPYNAVAARGLHKAEVFDFVGQDEYDPEITQRRLRAILKQRPNDTHALAFLGDLHANAGRRDLARLYYDSATASDSTNAYALFGKGVLWDYQSRWDSARVMYARAVELSEWNQTYLNNLAYATYMDEAYDEAILVYEKMLKLDDRFISPYAILPLAHLFRGVPASDSAAYYLLLKAQTLLSDSATVRLARNQGVGFTHVGDSTPVEVTSWDERRARSKFLLAVAELAIGRRREAIKHLRDSEALNDSLPLSLFRIYRDILDQLTRKRPDLRRAFDTAYDQGRSSQ